MAQTIGMKTAVQGCDRLRSPSGDAGARRRCCPISTTTGATSSSIGISTSTPSSSPAIRRIRRSAARPDWRSPGGAPGGDLDMIRRQALDPFGTRFAICNMLHGAVALFNEDMAAALCRAVNDWVAQGAARPRAAPARLDPGAAAQPGARGRRDRARRGRPALRPGAGVRDGRASCSAAASSGRSTRRPRGSACRSASMPAAPITMRRRRPAGPPIGWRTTSPSRPRSRRSCSASWPRACSRSFPTLKVVLLESGLHLAAAPDVAHQQDLARRAAGSSVDRSSARRTLSVIRCA